MKIKRFQYEQGYLYLTSNGFGSVHVTGEIDHIKVDFNFDSAEAWYLCFEPSSMAASLEDRDDEQRRIRATILGVALMQAEEGGAH